MLNEHDKLEHPGDIKNIFHLKNISRSSVQYPGVRQEVATLNNDVKSHALRQLGKRRILPN